MIIKGKLKLSEINSSIPFDCCGWWNVCQMGNKRCVHEEDDPDYAKLCSCYKRSKKRSQTCEEDVQRLIGWDQKTGQGYLL